MRFFLGIRPKILLALVGIAVLSLLLSFQMTSFLYERLYVEHIAKTLEDQGKMLMERYNQSTDLSQFQQDVTLADQLSEATILYTDNPRELGACLPFEEENDEALVSLEERQRLLNGEIIRSRGYNSRFDRDILAVSIPLMKDEQLLGVLFLYIPLAAISDTFSALIGFWVIFGILFVIIAFFISLWLTQRFTRPIRAMEQVAVQMASGSFGKRIKVNGNDEIARLGSVLNTLSTNLSNVEQKRREFIANLSHELRTPISYIAGYTELLRDGTAISEEQREQFMQIIAKESERMKRLVNDLLDLAQLEGEEYPLKLSLYPFAQQIKDSLASYLPLMQKKGIKVITDLDPDVIVYADQERMSQVLSNIIDNAYKYTPSDGTVSIRLTAPKESIILEISDTGMGIPEEDLPHIGERFYRVDKSRSREMGGTGLGIAIVKQIVKNHGGTLNIQSTLGKGTKVIICLPRWNEEGIDVCD